MSASVRSFIIRHIAGAKANQIEEFDFNSHDELTLGRSTENIVRFDPEIDKVVSREHGRIVKSNDNTLTFRLIDNNSRNGIYINGNRVNGSADLQPGDEVQLGSNGPAFVFDIDPRPAVLLPQTRLIEVARPTEELSPSVQGTEKQGVGKATFERVITHERKKSQRTLWASIAAAVVIMGSIVFVVWSKGKDEMSRLSGEERRRADSLLAANKGLSRTQVDSILNASKAGEGLAFEKIATDNTDKVVKIYISWGLFELSENEEIYHEYRPDANGFFHPLFVQTQAGIEPFLVTKRNSAFGLPVGSSGAGSGFVAASDGKILTNRHIGSAWKTRYTEFSWDNFPGYLVEGMKNGQPVLSKHPTVMPEDVATWVPSEATLVNGIQAQVEGRNKSLKVVFANSSQPYEAHLVTASQNHDVALIRVDLNNLEPVTMNDNYASVKSGQRIVVMGYPGLAPQQRVVRKSNDPMKPNPEVFTIASPVTSPGHIQQILKSSAEFSSRESSFGDSYQVDLNATGGGNSGGPMFDDNGNVIGIYYAGGGNAHLGIISFAVPIKYGMELLSVRKAD